jgi:histidyl-tRNA synthetase
MDLPDPVKGVPDWLPPESVAFDAVEQAFVEAARLGGYERIRVPVFEHTEVFARGVGEATDIVQKEMYTFSDRGGRSLTLRPEGTAGVVRAALNAGVPRQQALPVKYYYSGDFFRYERPQAGRQRSFSQVGVEALGSSDPRLDAEVVYLGYEALRRAGVEHVTLRINSLGDREDRPAYRERLNAYLDGFADQLPPDVADRRHLNPLRAFDSKAAGMDAIMAGAPRLIDHVNAEAKAHYEEVCRLLEAEGLELTHDPLLVRGLDYYTRTTFEYQSADLGAQNAVGGGGRYDGLAEDLGWPERLPGIGWALGVDRTLLSLQTAGKGPGTPPRVQAFVVVADAGLSGDAFALANELRRADVTADLAFDGRGLRGQLKAADRAGATVAIVLGRDEEARGAVTLRDLSSGEQTEIAREEAAREVAARFAG